MGSSASTVTSQSELRIISQQRRQPTESLDLQKPVCCCHVYVSTSGERSVIAGCEDGTIKIWIVNKKQLTFQANNRVIACVMTPSFIYAALAKQNYISVWKNDGTPLEPIEEHSSRILSCTITQDRHTIVSSSAECIKIWNSKTATKILEDESKITAVSSDGAYIVSGIGTILKVWRTKDSQLVRKIDIPIRKDKEILSCAISSDGTVVYSCENLFHLSKNDNSIQSLARQSKLTTCCDISPDGLFIVSGASDQTLTLWATSTGEELLNFTGHSSSVNSCFFSPDGTFVVSSGGNTVKIWDIPVGAWLRAIGFNIQDTRKYMDIFTNNKCGTLLALKSALPSQKILVSIKIPLGATPKILDALQLLQPSKQSIQSISTDTEICFVDKYFPTDVQWNSVNDNVKRCFIDSGEIFRFVWDNFPHDKFKIINVEMVRNSELIKAFLFKFNLLENRRMESDLFCTPLVDDGEKEFIRQKLLNLFTKDQNYQFANTLLMWHGCSEKACEDICKLGLADLRRTDGGFFGSGIYVTSYCKYALEYSKKDFSKQTGNSVVLLCLVTVGLTYPISRKTDYDQNSTISKFHYMYPNKVRNDKALMPGYDSHYICISKGTGYQAVTVDDADYDELVLKEESQILPLAIVHFS